MSDEQGQNVIGNAAGAAETAVKTAKNVKRAQAAKAAEQSAKAAEAVAGAAKTSAAASGTAVGTATAGPVGALIGSVVTSKTFWKALVSVLFGALLFFYVCVNIIPITMEHLGFSSADELVDSKSAQSIHSIKVRIQDIFDHVDGSKKKVTELVESQRDEVKKTIETDKKKEHEDCSKLIIQDEYETTMSKDFVTYLAYFLSNEWDSKTITNFVVSTDDDYTTSLESPYDEIFERSSKKYNVSCALIKAVGKVESDYNPKSHSSAGAMGIMQLMPEECKEWKISDPYDPEENIMAGAKYLASHIEAFKDHDNYMQLAVAAYNAGGGAVRKAGYQIPPYEETQNYVKKVFGYITINENKSDKVDYSGYYDTLKKGITENKDKLFDYGFEKEVDVKESDGTKTKTAYYNLILGEALNQSSNQKYDYSLCLTEDAFNTGLKIVKAAMDGVEAVWSVLDSIGDWMSSILDVFTGDGEDSDTDVKGDTISYDNVVDACLKKVVYYNQGESPWKDMKYGSGTIQSCGCGPTACAIAFSTLLGKNITPEDTCKYAMDHGEYTQGVGTNHSFPANAAKNWGITCNRVSKNDFSKVVSALKKGSIAVVICAPYTITQSGSGHYITLTGVTSSGNITIADPGSRDRTGKTYTQKQIKGFARDLEGGSIWIMSK